MEEAQFNPESIREISAEKALYSLCTLYAQACEDEFRASLKSLGLAPISSAHGRLLFTLSSSRQRLSMTEIAAILHRTKPNVTVAASHLEEMGLIKRKTSPADRRKVFLTVTAKGRLYAPAFRDVHENCRKRFLEIIGEELTERFGQIIASVADGADEQLTAAQESAAEEN